MYSPPTTFVTTTSALLRNAYKTNLTRSTNSPSPFTLQIPESNRFQSISTTTVLTASQLRNTTYQNQQQQPKRSLVNMQHGIRLAQFLTIGYTTFGSKGFLENSKSFDPKSLQVDLTGRNIIITGATSGLGKITAHELAKRHANIYLVVRDEQRGAKIREHILNDVQPKQGSENNIEVKKCDISSLKDIHELSKYFIDNKIPVHVLINNAGVMKSTYMESDDGLELAFATNTLGTFTLTEMLMPCLKLATMTMTSENSSHSSSARVINISSGGMLTEKLEINDLQGKNLMKPNNQIDGPAQYSRCKRRQVALAEYWSRKYSNVNISFYSMHPGWADTPGLKTSMSQFYNLTKTQLRSEEQGADTIVYLGAVQDVSQVKSGEFYFDRMPASKHLRFAGTQYDDQQSDLLANKLEQIVKDKGYSFPEAS